MRRMLLGRIVAILMVVIPVMGQQPFTLEQILSAPFPSDLVASKTGNRIAWTLNQGGHRNVWYAEGPGFDGRSLTKYDVDDGAELSELRFTADGNAIVYVRGEGKNSSGDYANPTSNPAGVEQTIWIVPVDGGAPVKVDAGHSPRVSVQGKVAYERAGQIYIATLGADLAQKDKPAQIIVRGKNAPVDWSADGARLLFVSDRGDHSFIGIYDLSSQAVKYLAPSVDADGDPVWSPEGKRVAFVRQPAVPRDIPEGYFIEPDRPHPWAIWVADANTGEGREIWNSGAAMQASHPYMAQETGGGVLNWAANETLIFASEADGWQHLYAMAASGGTAKLLTPGNCEVEQWSFSPDKKTVLFNSNCANSYPSDVDRRHLWSVSVTGGGLQQITGGKQEDGIEWAPVVLSDGNMLAFIGSGAREPAKPYISTFPNGHCGEVVESGSRPPTGRSIKELLCLVKPLAQDAWPKNFPSAELVAPQQVIFKSGDGLEIHGQLFLPKNLKAGEKRPALIFLHGGSMRQMLLGWHYMYYYANSYAMNQYLASRGYVVMAVNYRSGIGYGRAFREAPGRAGRGAAEYEDVVAAGKYLQSRNDVDAKKIGLWGGSYGGYLTALGLGRNSDLFAAGVDMHGVHDWPTDNWEGKNISPELTKLAHESSPVASVDTWKSPALFIHGDDDRNVMFSQTVDLVARLRARGVHVELLVFPDEIHDFLLTRTWLKAYQASSDFFDKQFQMPQK
jgi:dipeptidyl aminopeptidase/acylaminoacyl peptidase